MRWSKAARAVLEYGTVRYDCIVGTVGTLGGWLVHRSHVPAREGRVCFVFVPASRLFRFVPRGVLPNRRRRRTCHNGHSLPQAYAERSRVCEKQRTSGMWEMYSVHITSPLRISTSTADATGQTDPLACPCLRPHARHSHHTVNVNANRFESLPRA